MSLHEHQNFVFNKVDLKLPVVSREDPVFIGFYVDYITSGDTAASLSVSILPDACLGHSGLRI